MVSLGVKVTSLDNSVDRLERKIDHLEETVNTKLDAIGSNVKLLLSLAHENGANCQAQRFPSALY